ncbi:MAG: hypothetical protein U0894_08990 [Pirellulales bacterium]
MGRLGFSAADGPEIEGGAALALKRSPSPRHPPTVAVAFTSGAGKVSGN